MKKLLGILLCLITIISTVSCGSSISPEKKEELCSWYWESSADVMRFTEDGRIFRNFAFLHESDSRYTITDKEITMYLESFPEDAMTFRYRLEDDKLYIGEVEYIKYQEVTEEEKKAAREYRKEEPDNNTESKNAR